MTYRFSETEYAEVIAARRQAKPAARRRTNAASGHLSITEGRKLLRQGALESEVQSAITDYLDTQEIPYSVTDAREAFNDKGRRVCRVSTDTSDLIACLPPDGRLFAIEAKRAVGGVLSYGQACYLESIRQAGGLVVVARSVDCVIEATMRGIRQCDLDEIAKAIAKGPNLRPRRTREDRAA